MSTRIPKPPRHTPRRAGGPGSPVTANGKRITLSIDELTHARLLWAASTARLLGVDANLSSVTRAALELYTSHLEKVAAQLATVDESDEKGQRILAREKFRLLKANRGGSVPRAYPEQAVADAMHDPAVPFPMFGDLMRGLLRKQLAIPLPDPTTLDPVGEWVRRQDKESAK